MARQRAADAAAAAQGRDVASAADTRSAVENSNELAGPQKDAHRSSYATSAPPKPAPHRGGGHHSPPPDPPRSRQQPEKDAAVAATAAELEEALQEVARRGARIEALTCEVAWYRHWADSYWQQLQSLSAAAAAASNQHAQQQQLAAFANFQNAANQNFAAAAHNFATAAAAASVPVPNGPHGMIKAPAASAAAGAGPLLPGQQLPVQLLPEAAAAAAAAGHDGLLDMDTAGRGRLGGSADGIENGNFQDDVGNSGGAEGGGGNTAMLDAAGNGSGKQEAAAGSSVPGVQQQGPEGLAGQDRQQEAAARRSAFHPVAPASGVSRA